VSNFKPIETQYKGYRFRSRLEARWAVFFDALHVKWEYEKEGFELGPAGWYLPDFYLPDLGFWVEIKPVEPSDDERRKAMELSHGVQQPVALQIGLPLAIINPDYNVWEMDGSKNLEIFAGYPTDQFSNEYTTWFIDYFYGTSELEDLAEMLSVWLKKPVVFDGTPESIESLVELDKSYFRHKYGQEHYRWRWGRHDVCFGWHSDHDRQIHANNQPFLTPRVAQAYIDARSARFEHGENQ
jgi:hypothetical protein